MHPRWLRCSSLKHSRYSRSSRLAIGAPRPSRCDARLSPRAVKVAPTGKDAGLGKRTLLGRNSILLLNKDIVDPHEDAWTNEDIEKRSCTLAKVLAEAWPIG